MKSLEMKTKLIVTIFPLSILLFLFIFFQPKKEIVIAGLSNVTCDEVLKIGMKIQSINGIIINSISDFEEIKSRIKENQTFFIFADNKIVKCKNISGIGFDLEEIETKVFYLPINFERIVVRDGKFLKNFLQYIGFNNFILDREEIILPLDNKLFRILSSKKNLEFYLERNLERENETVKILDKNIPINYLYEIFDSVVVSEKNVTVTKYLFNHEFIEDFEFKIKYIYPLAINFVNITFKINQTALKRLTESLKDVQLRLIQLEKYYDAKLVIKTENQVIFSFFLPYREYENEISVVLTNLENPNKVREILMMQLITPKEIRKENRFKLFEIDTTLLILLLSILIITKIKLKTSLIDFYSLPLIISSFFFPFSYSLTLIFFNLLFFIRKRYIKFELLILTIFSLIISLIYLQKIYFSIFSFSISILSLIILEYFYIKFRKYEFFFFSVFSITSLLLFFFNSLISFSLILSLLLKFFVKFFPYF